MTTTAEMAVNLLRKSADIIEERSKEYGGNSFMFRSAAERSGISIDDVFNVLMSIKEERLICAPDHTDSLVDLMAYSALKMTHRHINTAAALLPRDERKHREMSDYSMKVAEESK
jgi:hypothetical protein